MLPRVPSGQPVPKETTPSGNGDVPLLRTWRQRSRMVPSKVEFLQNPEAAKHLALTYFGVRMRSQDVPSCEWLYKRPRESLLLSSAESVLMLWRSHFFGSFCSRQRTVSAGQACGKSTRWEQVFSFLSLWGLLTFSTWTQSLLIGKGITQSFQLFAFAIPNPSLLFF